MLGEEMLGTLIFTVGGAVLGGLLPPVMNRIPAAWICEYGERPQARHQPPRIKGIATGPLTAAGFALISGLLWNASHHWGYAAASTVFLWLLIQSAVLDAKYLILPDQYTIGLWICGLCFLPFQESWRSPAEGALLCGGGMLFAGFLGGRMRGAALEEEDGAAEGACAGQSAVGFGDVKLMAVLGFSFGLGGGTAVLCGSALLSGSFMAIFCLLRRANGTDLLPFGPYAALASGAWLLSGGGFFF